MPNPDDPSKKNDPDQTADSARPLSTSSPTAKSELEFGMAAAFDHSESTVQHVSRPVESSGMVIAGKYKLIQQIGEGGMGSVWLAEQREPVKRMVQFVFSSDDQPDRTITCRKIACDIRTAAGSISAKLRLPSRWRSVIGFSNTAIARDVRKRHVGLVRWNGHDRSSVCSGN